MENEQTSSMDIDLEEVFSAEEATEDTTEVEETEEEQEETEAEEEPAEEEEKFQIKHNGQVIELTRDEVIKRAQMGTDYERIRSDRDSLRGQMSKLDEMAKNAGLGSGAELLEQFESTMAKNQIAQRADQLLEEGYTEEQAEYVAKLEQQQKAQKAKEEKEKAEAQAQQKSQADIQAQLDRFFTQYPEAKKIKSYDDMPEDFRNAVSNGATFIEAWQGHLINEMRQKMDGMNSELSAHQQNTKNKHHAAPSAKGDKGVDKHDVFLTELFKD